MKTKLLISLGALLIVSFTILSARGNNKANQYIQKDTTQQKPVNNDSNNTGMHHRNWKMHPDMMSRGMMNGKGMMGGSMMNGGMMGGRGMMNNRNPNYGTMNNQPRNNNQNWTAPASANNLANPIKNIEKASRIGKRIFEDQCFTCHGTDARGDGPVASTLNPRPANLTSAKVQNQSDGAIFWKITNGNPPMPGFKPALSKDQRWDLVTFIKTLK